MLYGPVVFPDTQLQYQNEGKMYPSHWNSHILFLKVALKGDRKCHVGRTRPSDICVWWRWHFAAREQMMKIVQAPVNSCQILLASQHVPEVDRSSTVPLHTAGSWRLVAAKNIGKQQFLKTQVSTINKLGLTHLWRGMQWIFGETGICEQSYNSDTDDPFIMLSKNTLFQKTGPLKQVGITSSK